MVERYRDGSAFETIGSYSRALRAGSIIAVSGTAATGPDGEALHPGDTYLQTKRALEQALVAARELGGDTAHVIRTRLLLAPESEWREAVRAHHEAFAGFEPANTTFFVAAFIPPGVLVEVELDVWANR